MISRRSVLATGVLVSLAGCSSIPGRGEEPRYSTDDELPLTVESLREEEGDDRWQESEEDRNPNFDYEFEMVGDEDAIRAFILAHSEAYDEIEGAEAKIQEPLESADEQELDLADEAYVWEEENHARAYFRHSNAVGATVAARMSGYEALPDAERAVSGIRGMYSDWQD